VRIGDRQLIGPFYYPAFRGTGSAPPRNEPPTLAVGLTWCNSQEGNTMNNIIWLIGAVVVVIAILSFLGLR
jgi:hypothetical protein